MEVGQGDTLVFDSWHNANPSRRQPEVPSNYLALRPIVTGVTGLSYPCIKGRLS
jgi:hypothetical protein